MQNSLSEAVMQAVKIINLYFTIYTILPITRQTELSKYDIHKYFTIHSTIPNCNKTDNGHTLMMKVKEKLSHNKSQIPTGGD